MKTVIKGLCYQVAQSEPVVVMEVGTPSDMAETLTERTFTKKTVVPSRNVWTADFSRPVYIYSYPQNHRR